LTALVPKIPVSHFQRPPALLNLADFKGDSVHFLTAAAATRRRRRRK